MRNLFSISKILKSMVVTIMTVYFTAGCTPSPIGAGEEGVLVKKPFFFGSGGVDPTPITTGTTWTALTTDVVRYNTKPYRIDECFEDLTASDNVAIDFCSYITLQIHEGKTPILHEKLGLAWYDNNVKDVYRTAVRNEARNKSSIDLRTNDDEIRNSQAEILNQIRTYIQTIEVPATINKVVIGKVTPPQEVLKEAERTAAQKQRKDTETARAAAELLRAQAETNAALADKAYANEFKMTTDQFLRNKELDLMSKAVDGGKVTLIMNASDAKPIFTAK